MRTITIINYWELMKWCHTNRNWIAGIIIIIVESMEKYYISIIIIRAIINITIIITIIMIISIINIIIIINASIFISSIISLWIITISFTLSSPPSSLSIIAYYHPHYNAYHQPQSDHCILTLQRVCFLTLRLVSVRRLSLLVRIDTSQLAPKQQICNRNYH